MLQCEVDDTVLDVGERRCMRMFWAGGVFDRGEREKDPRDGERRRAS